MSRDPGFYETISEGLTDILLKPKKQRKEWLRQKIYIYTLEKMMALNVPKLVKDKFTDLRSSANSK